MRMLAVGGTPSPARKGWRTHMTDARTEFAGGPRCALGPFIFGGVPFARGMRIDSSGLSAGPRPAQSVQYAF